MEITRLVEAMDPATDRGVFSTTDNNSAQVATINSKTSFCCSFTTEAFIMLPLPAYVAVQEGIFLDLPQCTCKVDIGAVARPPETA